MHPFSILLLGLAMSTDALAASVSKGAARQGPRLPDALRAGVVFGLIAGVTPVVGWRLGVAASDHIRAWDHWIAFTLLGLLGLHMIRAGLRPARRDPVAGAAERGQGLWGIAATGVATSMDSLAVGVGLAFVEVNIGIVALVIGVTTLVLVTAGTLLGRVLGGLAGRRVEVVGGLLLIAIGASILHDHLTA